MSLKDVQILFIVEYYLIFVVIHLLKPTEMEKICRAHFSSSTHSSFPINLLYNHYEYDDTNNRCQLSFSPSHVVGQFVHNIDLR